MAVGAPQALDALVALLGEPDDRDEGGDACGSGIDATYGWDDLTAFLGDGTLIGWSVRGATTPVPVALPLGLPVGTPLGVVEDRLGASAALWEEYDVWTIGDGGARWWAESGAPTAPVVLVSGGTSWCD
ncbi:hypothetical protein Cma02nite_01770 [Cellulomonas marina]|uniref:Uncharacterized protein n=1 Tax=Cellulomonas marina TaxID=988821 RepID=A0A1I0YQJ4_9CELL|nr:hypothetical protein Cma02nite_01770 [Cellulomonas marina]SFB15481.1 hypothetical protein SAMN05421867_10898 [Cellulomonas marina]